MIFFADPLQAVQKRQTETTSRFEDYEYLKSQWQLENPGATPAEYERAIKKIAEECGV